MPGNRVVYTVTLGDLAEVPGAPFTYWAPPSLRSIFQKYAPLDRDVARQPSSPKIADVKVGLQTGDDLRSNRFWWETAAGQIAVNSTEAMRGKRWAPYARGPWLDSFYADISMVVHWRNSRGDADAIVPLFDADTADGSLERGLAFRVREQLRELLGEGAMPGVERDVEAALGVGLDHWLATGLFAYHAGLYRLRPVVWQLASKPRGPAAFACFVY